MAYKQNHSPWPQDDSDDQEDCQETMEDNQDLQDEEAPNWTPEEAEQKIGNFYKALQSFSR